MVLKVSKRIKKNKAVFLDRDGTIIFEKPGVYLADPKKVILYKNTLAGLKKLYNAGYKLFVISNQSGIGRGYFTAKETQAVNHRLCQLFRPVRFDEIVFCPHAPNEACSCRKPLPKLGLQLIKKYHIDPKRSFMVGDKKSDVDFGHALGCKSILVKTANGPKHLKKYPDLKPDFVASDLLRAAHFILQEESL